MYSVSRGSSTSQFIGDGALICNGDEVPGGVWRGVEDCWIVCRVTGGEMDAGGMREFVFVIAVWSRFLRAVGMCGRPEAMVFSAEPEGWEGERAGAGGALSTQFFRWKKNVVKAGAKI